MVGSTSGVLRALSIDLLVVSMIMTMAPSEAFAPRSHPRAIARTELARKFSSPFDWINDVFGDKSKKAEEEAAAKARAEAAAQKKAEEEAAARAAAEAAAQQKAAEEAAAKQRAEEEAAMRIARAKAEAEAEFARFEAEQKAKAEAAEAAAAAAKAAREEAEAAAAAEKLAQEEEARAEAEAAAKKEAEEKAAAVDVAEVEVAEKAAKEEADETDDKIELMSEKEGKKYAQEAFENNVRIRGAVQWYTGEKGFGFIKPYRTKAEREVLVQSLRRDRWQKEIEKKAVTYDWGIFVHHSDIKAPDDTFFRKLYALESVEMDIAIDKRGRPVARNVTGLDGKYVRRIVKEQQQREEATSAETE